MNQPDLGLKIAEQRQAKGLTQEQLAEYCEVSVRTIQRIECGETEPRPVTRNSLGNALDFDFGEDNTPHEAFWLALLHLSSVLSNIFVPLLVWSLLKKRSYQIDRQGRDVINFQITTTLMLFTSTLFLLIVVPAIALLRLELGGQIGAVDGMLAVFGSVPLILVGFFCFYQGVVNTIRVLSGRPYRYPLSIPFVR